MTARENTLEVPGKQVKSAFRAIEILEYFAARQEGATLTQIATALDYPQSSASMLVGSLVAMGYLALDKQDHLYRPTLRVMLLGAWQQESLHGTGSMVAGMKTLAMRTRAGVMVGLRQGLRVRFIISLLPSLQTSALWFPPGVLRPVCESAAGKVLLANESDDEIRRIAEAAKSDSMHETPIDVDALVREIRECRTRGWAESLDYPKPGWANIAMAWPKIDGHPEMAVTLGVRRQSLEQRRDTLLNELRRALEQVNHGAQS